jgi:glycosyltransferase involved in cell wall biosynthesis
MSKVSYLVTCSTETDTLERLLTRIVSILGDDQLLILQDESSKSEDTDEIIKIYFDDHRVGLYAHPLNKDYGGHKNYGIEKCKGDWIFQIDGDEMPPESLLGENLHALIDSNPSIEAYAMPRINAWHGLTPEHAKQWGWGLDMSPTYGRLRAAWPDYQWRLFKNAPHIRFQKRLHERIEGFKSYAGLPTEEEWALYHDKTIETQVKTNLRYNEWFTAAENAGVSNKRD